MSTHIAAKPGQIAPYVLMPGDPLRAKWIAETFLEDTEVYSEVRGMLGFTGTYRGERLGAGLGDGAAVVLDLRPRAVRGVRRPGGRARRLLRRAERGPRRARHRDRLGCVHRLVDERIRFEGLDYAPVADFGLLRAAVEAAEEMDLPVQTKVGLIMSSDSFYSARPRLVTRMADYGVLAVEMEAAALYTLAAKFKRRG